MKGKKIRFIDFLPALMTFVLMIILLISVLSQNTNNDRVINSEVRNIALIFMESCFFIIVILDLILVKFRNLAVKIIFSLLSAVIFFFGCIFILMAYVYSGSNNFIISAIICILLSLIVWMVSTIVIFTILKKINKSE